MANEYIAAFLAGPKDLVHYGRKGMRWGVRRDRAALRADPVGKPSAKKESTEEKAKASSGSSAAKPSGNIQDNVESSATRYARLSQEAKSGRANAMTEQDLKFFNARTDALAKVNKLNETDPGWLSKTTKSVIQKSAQRQMQMVSDTIADKYIGKPIADALKTPIAKPSKDDDDD
jgi:hypothetical protein